MHKLSQRNVFKDNLFLAKSCKIFAKFAFFARETTLVNFLQEMKKCCKIGAKSLQDVFFKKFCKSCIDCKNFARFIELHITLKRSAL